MSTHTSSTDTSPVLSDWASLPRQIRKHAWHYVFVLPMLILFVLFTLWPMAGSIYYSFFNWDGVGPPTKFVGMDNFKETLINPYFWNAFKNNYIFAFAHLLVQYPIALLFAIVLNNAMLRARNVYRLLIFLPVVTTTAMIGLVFNVLLHPAGGPINETLLRIGLLVEPINFLGSEKLALLTAIGISIWKNIGITMIYWLAALQTIPHDLYEDRWRFQNEVVHFNHHTACGTARCGHFAANFHAKSASVRPDPGTDPWRTELFIGCGGHVRLSLRI
jgi:raffinose/stachyose/melibiose transport system permease protein